MRFLLVSAILCSCVLPFLLTSCSVRRLATQGADRIVRDQLFPRVRDRDPELAAEVETEVEKRKAEGSAAPFLGALFSGGYWWQILGALLGAGVLGDRWIRMRRAIKRGDYLAAVSEVLSAAVERVKKGEPVNDALTLEVERSRFGPDSLKEEMVKLGARPSGYP